jgi:hypothetical protein
VSDRSVLRALTFIADDHLAKVITAGGNTTQLSSLTEAVTDLVAASFLGSYHIQPNPFGGLW